MRIAPRLAAFAIVALIGTIGCSMAFSADIRFDSEEPAEFSLYISRLDATLDENRPPVETTTERIGVSWFTRLQPRTDAGLFGGYSFASQTGTDLTAGMNFSGAHGGLVMRRMLVERGRVDLRLLGKYTYQNIDDERDAQKVRLSWHQFDAGLGADIRLGPFIGLYGELTYGRITGTETASGAINRTTGFDHDARAGGIVGINFLSRPDGLIGLRAHTGINDGVEIIFTRRYY